MTFGAEDDPLDLIVAKPFIDLSRVGVTDPLCCLSDQAAVLEIHFMEELVSQHTNVQVSGANEVSTCLHRLMELLIMFQPRIDQKAMLRKESSLEILDLFVLVTDLIKLVLYPTICKSLSYDMKMLNIKW